MSDASSKPGPFICPPGFTLASPDEELPVVDDEEEELCLIRTPWEFDMGLLKNQKIPLSGSAVVQGAEDKCYECQSSGAADNQLRHMKALFPGKSGVLVPFSFGWHLTIAETLVIPDIEELASSSEKKVKHVDLPHGLCQRFQPFGSDKPIITQIGCKKKSSRKSHHTQPSTEDSPDLSRKHRKRLKGSKRQENNVFEDFSLQESSTNQEVGYKKFKRHFKELDPEESGLGATDGTRVKEEPQSGDVHSARKSKKRKRDRLSDTHNESYLPNAHETFESKDIQSTRKSKKRKHDSSFTTQNNQSVAPNIRKDRTAVSDDIQNTRKSKKRKRDSSPSRHHQGVEGVNNEVEISLKKRESFLARNYYVESDEEDRLGNSRNHMQQSSPTGAEIGTPKKKKKHKKHNDELLKIKEEVVTPPKVREGPSSVKKKKKKRSSSDVRVKIEYPEPCSDSD